MHSGWIAAAWLTLAACAAAGSAAAQAPAATPVESPAAAPAEARPEQLQEILVTGERAGPGLWRVSRGAADVWILGTVAPLPKGITWRSQQVEQVLGRSSAVLTTAPLGVGIVRALWILLTHRELLMVHDGRRLRDVLPPDLYARFAAQRAKYEGDGAKWERYRPLLAAAFLEEAALHKAGLSTRIDIGAEVRRLADGRDIPVEEVKVAGVRDLLDTLKTVPAATENTCVAAALSTVESGLPKLVARAAAWSTGDVERLQAIPESPEEVACRVAVGTDSGSADLLARIRNAWLTAVEQRLRAGGTTLAVVNVDLLLESGGLLDELRARGYAVTAP